MAKRTPASAVLTVRITPDMDRRLAREARRRRRTRSELVRTILEAACAGAPEPDPAAEARRQSVLASARASEHDALAFIASAADLEGWE